MLDTYDGTGLDMFRGKKAPMTPGKALTWKLPGRRKRGRPKDTWRRMVEKKRNQFGWKR